MTRLRWMMLALAAMLALQGCIIPRAVGGVVKGTGKVVGGAVDVVTAPF